MSNPQIDRTLHQCEPSYDCEVLTVLGCSHSLSMVLLYYMKHPTPIIQKTLNTSNVKYKTQNLQNTWIYFSKPGRL